MQNESPKSFKTLLIIFGGGLFLGICTILILIIGVISNKNNKSELVTANISNLTLILPESQISSLIRQKDGSLLEINIKLNNSPEPQNTGSINKIFNKSHFHSSVMLRPAESEIDPKDRLSLIWQRYLKSDPFQGPSGLEGRIFQPGSPYDGEVLFTDPVDPRKFAVRCLQATETDQPEICLREMRVVEGKIDLLIKFPRSWLSDWREIDKVVIDELNEFIK
jgi:hypothetical protein